jgi:hypothetical protein
MGIGRRTCARSSARGALASGRWRWRRRRRGRRRGPRSSPVGAAGTPAAVLDRRGVPGADLGPVEGRSASRTGSASLGQSRTSFASRYSSPDRGRWSRRRRVEAVPLAPRARGRRGEQVLAGRLGAQRDRRAEDLEASRQQPAARGEPAGTGVGDGFEDALAERVLADDLADDEAAPAPGPRGRWPGAALPSRWPWHPPPPRRRAPRRRVPRRRARPCRSRCRPRRRRVGPEELVSVAYPFRLARHRRVGRGSRPRASGGRHWGCGSSPVRCRPAPLESGRRASTVVVSKVVTTAGS